MTQTTMCAPTMTVGLDLGDRESVLCVLDEAGSVVERGRIRTSAAALRARFEGRARCRIALEAGTQSAWISELLDELGHEVIVANPRKVKLISQSHTKSDDIDAEHLARLARSDPKLLGPIQHRGRTARRDLTLLRARDGVVQVRTKLINQVRGLLKTMGLRVVGCSAEAFSKHARTVVPAELVASIEPLLDLIDHVSSTIDTYDARVMALAENYPETELLRQVRGVGPITSLTFVLTLEDPHRFKTSRAVGSWLGLRPARNNSAKHDPELRITKAGDVALRRLLVTAAHYILGPFGPDTDLRRWGLNLASRGKKNAKKRAIVAVARKLAVLLHRLWITGEEYEPLRNANVA